MEIIFWCCAGLVAYVYIGYPICAIVVSSFLRRDVRKSDILPPVTVLIAAFNEEDEIQNTVLNKLAQDYPSDLLDIIVVSDGSSDRTDEIVQSLCETHGSRLKLLRQVPRQGKTQAINFGIGQARGSVVVFSDANSVYAPDTVRKLAANFADPSVGYVTGTMVYTNDQPTGVGQSSGHYMSYENALRTAETRLGSVVGVDGGVDAIRRELYVPMRPDQLPDFVLPLTIVETGSRVVYERGALVYESALSRPADEFRMRVRVSLRAFWALYDKRRLLNPFRFPLYSWQLFSHKVLRYLAFVPITGLFVANAFLIDRHWLYAIFFAGQAAMYAIAVLGHFMERSRAGLSKLLVPYYFVILNAACLVAFWRFLRGQKMVLWKPRVGV